MKQLIFAVTVLSLLIWTSSCTSEQQAGTSASFQVFTLLDTAETGLNFINSLEERPDFNIFFYDYFYNGGGVAIGDINNDGLPDILLTANTGHNRLFLNKGDLKFEDITATSGLQNNYWSQGAVFHDINGDGLVDIYICNAGPYRETDSLKNELYINQGDNTFREAAAEYGIDGIHRSTQAGFFDYDGDGLLDLFVLNHSDLVFRIHDIDKATGDYPESKHAANSNVLYRNNGNGTFTDVTREAGLLQPGFGLGMILSDMNGDGLVDIYVSNDYLPPNNMYINQGDGTFKDEIKTRLEHSSHFSMGIDYGDINNDGLMDIAEVDMMPADHVLNKTFMRPMNAGLFFEFVEDKGLLPQFMFNCLHIQHGYGIYSDIAQMAGVGKTDWSWSALLADVDNDGWRDYLVTNGYRRNLKNNDFMLEMFPSINRWMATHQYDSVYQFLQQYPGYPLVNYLFKNNRDLTFENMAPEWGLDLPTYSYGAAFVDLDLDGDLDLVINNTDQEAFLYRNNTSEMSDNAWIQFDLIDSGKKQRPYNTLVEIKQPDGSTLIDELRTVRGYQSSTDPIVHFGLGKTREIAEVKIIWPDRQETILRKPELNKRHTIDRSLVMTQPSSPPQSPDYAWRDVSTTVFNKVFYHQEDDYHDFATEILLPYRQSRLGPLLGVGDATGNGLMDFYIGGAKDQPGQLYLMDPDRGFHTGPCQPWISQAGSEDMGSVFFDADGDGDLDLYVVSGGGGEFEPGSPLLRDRLYLNQGNGCFSGPVEGAVPNIRSSGGRVVAADFDGDGLTDLFVCGRTYPGKYPFPAESVFLKNTGGRFEDVTDLWAPDIRHIGMVTDAVVHDFNGDGKPDLLLAGAWMTLRLFINEGGSFVERTEEYGFADKTGWWYSLTLVDVNGDGKMDIVAGNLGQNNKFKFTDASPLHVFAHDFDDNGTIDIVLSNKYKDNLVPLRGRQCSSDQMPFIKEKFPTYAQFANATLEDVYGADKLEAALHYKANECRSMVWLNQGKRFEPIPLPKAAQMGPILSAIVLDANADGIPDLIIGGAHSDTEPETPAFNGGRGMLLLGKGNGEFTPVWLKRSGFYFPLKNVRDLAFIPLSGQRGQLLLASGNNSRMVALQFMGKTQ